MNATGRPMVFSCSWAVYFTICASKHPPSLWESQCGAVPWRDGLIGDVCHMWRYGEDLRPQWTDGKEGPGRWSNGAGGSGVGDVLSFASSFWASAWRGAAGSPGRVLDPDFLVVGCPTDGPCEPLQTCRRHVGTLSNARNSVTKRRPDPDCHGTTRLLSKH